MLLGAAVLNLLLLLLAHSVCPSSALTLAACYPLTGPEAAVGVQCQRAGALAAAAVSNATSTPVTLQAFDSGGELGLAASAAFAALSGGGVDAVVGCATNAASEGVAIVGRVLSVAQVSYGAPSDLLSDASAFPFFTRVVPDDVATAAATATAVFALGWRHVALVASSDGEDTFGAAFLGAAAAVGLLVEAVMEHRSPRVVGVDAANASVTSGLAAVAASPARVVIMSNDLQDARFVLSAAAQLGMVGGDYQWLGTEAWLKLDVLVPDDTCSSACIDTFRTSLQGALGVEPAPEAGALASWQAATWDPGADNLTTAQAAASGLSSWVGASMEPLAPFAYDAVWLATLAVQAACGTAGGCSADLAPNVTAAMQTTSLAGATGTVDLGGFRTRVMPFAVLNYVAGPSRFVDVGSITATGMASVDEASITWGTASGEKPVGLATVVCAPGSQLQVSITGVQFCVECAPGSYNLDGVTCLPCPTGAQCDGGTNVATLPGYWRGSLTRRNDELFFYRCGPNPLVCCPHGNCSVVPEALDNTARCAVNREGPLCGRCIKGTSEWNGNCVPCDGVAAGGVSGLVLASVFSALVFLMKRPAKNAVARVIVDYLQLAALLIAPLPSRGGVAAFLSTDILNLDVSGLFGGKTDDEDGTDLGTCLMPLSPVETVVFGYTMPFLLLASIGMWFLVSRLLPILCPRGLPKMCKKKAAPTPPPPTSASAGTLFSTQNPVRHARAPGQRRRQEGPSALQKLVAKDAAKAARDSSQPLAIPAVKFQTAVWRWVFVCYNVVVMTGFELLLCRTVDGDGVLQLAPGVQCYDNVAALVLGLVALIVSVFGVPITLVLLYRWHLAARRIDSAALSRRKQLLAVQNQLRGSHMPPTSASTAPGLVSAVQNPRELLEAHTAFPSAARVYGVPESAAAAKTDAKPTLPPGATEDDDLAASGALFTEMYKLYRLPVRGWFEAAYFTRRTLFVVLLLFLTSRDLIWRAVAGFVSVVAMTAWVLVWRPYALQSDNILAASLMGSAVVIAGLEIYATQAFLNDQSQPDDSRRDVFIDVMYVLLFGWPLVYFLRFQVMGVTKAVTAALEKRRSKKTAEWRKRHASVVMTGDRRADDATEIEIQEWVDSTVLDGEVTGATESSEAKSLQALSSELNYLRRVVANDTTREVRATFHST